MSDEFIEKLKFYSKGRIGAQEIFSKDFTTWWHPKIGGKLVRMVDRDIQFKTRDEALQEAKRIKDMFKKKMIKREVE